MKYLIVFFIVCSMIGEFVPRYEADITVGNISTWLTANIGKTKKL